MSKARSTVATPVNNDTSEQNWNAAEPNHYSPVPVGVWDPKIFSYTITNSDQIDRLNAYGGIAVDFDSTSRKATHLAFDGVQNQMFSVWTTHSRHGFVTTPKEGSDLVTIRFVTQGAMARHERPATTITARTGQAMLVRFDDMRSEHASRDFAALSATLSERAITDAYQALTGDIVKGTLGFIPAIEVKTAGVKGLQQILTAMHGQVRSHHRELDLLAPMLQEIAIYQVLNHWPGLQIGETPEGHVSARALKRALDYMDAHLGRKLSVAEIAAAAGLSVRVLQTTFKRELGCSPIQYLIDRRLDHVHEALQRSEEVSIRHIAMRWGFVHPSDFSRRYHARFGHPPRVTRSGKGV